MSGDPDNTVIYLNDVQCIIIRNHTRCLVILNSTHGLRGFLKNDISVDKFLFINRQKDSSRTTAH